jgi:integration host factor subunit beta
MGSTLRSRDRFLLHVCGYPRKALTDFSRFYEIQGVLWSEDPVTKKEIARQLSERLKLSQVDTQRVVQGTFDAVVDALARYGRIELRNFGVFEVRQRAARKARNPRTGEEVLVPARRVVVFKAGREMGKEIR